MAWGKGMVDMARSTEEKISAIEESMPMPTAAAEYPYGLCISLDERDLEKLGLTSDCEAGDTLDLRAMATVKSVSLNDYNGKKSCNIQLQIEKLAVENEDEEYPVAAKRYGRK
jgi:Major coat protein-like